MRAFLSLLLLLVSPTIARPQGAPAEIDFALYWRLAPSVFKVEAHNPNGRISVGSGVLVAENLVVTNCHVTRDATHIQVVKQGERWDVRAQASDVEHDLCVLKVPNVTGRVAPVRAQPPKVGQSVIAIGYVGGQVPRLSGGEVQALYHFDGGRVIRSTAWFNSGASGGGLFDEEGNLIGIIAFRHQRGQSQFFALPVDWIYEGKLDWETAREVKPLGQGVPFWQQVGDRQPYFLKAAALEASRDWPALRELAQKWAAAESDKPDAWLALGKAYEQMGELDRAIEAYGRAIQSDLECSEAWYSIGLAYVARGAQRELQEVQRVLLTLNQDLASKLSQRARGG
jgi:hypothetical protein